MIELKCVVELIDGLRETAHVREFPIKHRAAGRYNSKVKQRQMQKATWY